MIRWMVFIAGLVGCVAVALGAYGAHGLEKNLVEQGIAPEDIAKRLEQCDIAVRYHMIHTLALLSLALASTASSRVRSVAAIFFLLGMALFSGGLYSMVFTGVMGHWAIVPSGGLCFMLGWLAVATLAFGRSADTRNTVRE